DAPSKPIELKYCDPEISNLFVIVPSPTLSGCRVRECTHPSQKSIAGVILELRERGIEKDRYRECFRVN
ncbi:hypothetical protein ACCS96_37855, partial [Rhizobium ruizarguesonis]